MPIAVLLLGKDGARTEDGRVPHWIGGFQELQLKEADRMLVEAIRSGSEQAFEELYEAHFRRIHNFAVSKLGSVAEAEDVTQEVFAAVFSCLDRFEGKSDLIVWIYGITRNILNNRLRRRAGIRMVALDELPMELTPVDIGPEREAVAREDLRRVQAVVNELPKDQRRILELRHSNRMAIRKIAQVMNRSEDAVKSSLYRTRQTLAARLPDAKPSA
jgi:RNA polymerase sigma-70 factor (ECF subfamily)